MSAAAERSAIPPGSPTGTELPPDESGPQRIGVREFSSVCISVLIHAVALLLLALLHVGLPDAGESYFIESFDVDQSAVEEFTKVLETETDPSNTFSIASASSVSTSAAGSGAAGGSASLGPATPLVPTETFGDPVRFDLKPSLAEGAGMGVLGEDLGEAEVAGESGAPVDDYAAALSRITLELLRLMRKEKLLVVWLFDESESMKDDQREIRDKFHKVYDELGLATRGAGKSRPGEEPLHTVVSSYGKSLHEILPQATADGEAVKQAIDRIPVDESGEENMCAAVSATVDRWRTQASRNNRRLVLVLVSDESGDDGTLIDGTIQKVRHAKAPVYVLGREAVFGSPWAHVRWKDPKFGLWHHLRISRGPESAFAECLQWDGLHGRQDSFSSGFGPYEQVRLAKETGGIFFVLPGEEQDLSGAGAREQRQFDFLDLKEYQPALVPRPEYDRLRAKSEFRRTLLDVVARLDPARHRELGIREHWFPLDRDGFRKEAQGEVTKAFQAMQLLDEISPVLDRLAPLRDSEPSERWRAHFDLMQAQLLCYRVRLFQYLLVMDRHVNAFPEPSQPNSNVWNLARTRPQLVPDDAQFGRLKQTFRIRIERQAYLDELQAQELRARQLFDLVQEQHPRTPWARRAAWELSLGFGVRIADAYRDPNYVGRDIKLPKF